ncbi:LysR family transcriptional regulator [Roseibium sp. CAU 1637]|uniref:LysR family transcriptional regulator n=1 Tax=Roseibium limicola TaxID=2816037 RepID=A0A939ERA3_9HYPH|nr:LysR family transcriptional regulator [Roseibium limicola]MBO0347053.1 LysR family transcriptional regulator [Roseibium limicola]
MKHFRLLVAIDEEKSLLKAADAISITQPGASKLLRDIETAFGEILFDRSPHGLIANESGLCAIRYAQLILNDLTHLRDELVNIKNDYKGFLSVGMTMGATPLMCDGLLQLLESQPGSKFQILEGTSFQLLKWLEEGRIELAICRTNVSPRPETYATSPLGQEEIIVISNTGHKLASKTAIPLSDLIPDRWIVFAPGTPMRSFLERVFRATGEGLPDHIIETTSLLVITQFLSSDPRCCAIIPKSVARTVLNDTNICELDVAMERLDLPNLVVQLAGRQLSKSAQALKQYLIKNS